ncbi:DMT family transporter [Polaromonas sp. UC242_47]|uniref:DMT family transporter n=1 Tax=Polaromonas sp. UC242_47 TaxID=3374626 RepID=UPI0037996E14
MSRLRLVILVVLAMVAFAGNSLLCRMALKHTPIDPASFTAMRLLSGACMLCCVVWLRQGKASSARAASPDGGNWLSACALFVYAAGFSYAYVSMSAATGALLLFGTVQATMVGYGVWQGERLQRWQLVGFSLAVAGLVALMLPGLAAPSLLGSVSMMSAGAAWGIYSLRGKGAGDPTRVTAGNFLRTLPMALVLSLLMIQHLSPDVAGLALAVLSGALASGLGYALWYQALPVLPATQAASVQLSVPVLAALGGIVFIGEALSWPTVLASVTILGGIALVILNKKQPPTPKAHLP